MYFIHYAIIIKYDTFTTLTSIDHCNISLSTITPMLQHTGMEVFDQSSQCRISCTIPGTLEIPDTRYPICLKTIRYEPDSDTNTDIITSLLKSGFRYSIHQTRPILGLLEKVFISFSGKYCEIISY